MCPPWLKFIYSEKASRFCEIFPLLLTAVHTVKSKGKISQNFVAFSEYTNFNVWLIWSILIVFLIFIGGCPTFRWVGRHDRICYTKIHNDHQVQTPCLCLPARYCGLYILISYILLKKSRKISDTYMPKYWADFEFQIKGNPWLSVLVNSELSETFFFIYLSPDLA